MLTLRSNDAIRFALEAVTVLILKKLTVPARRHAEWCSAAAEPLFLPRSRS